MYVCACKKVSLFLSSFFSWYQSLVKAIREQTASKGAIGSGRRVRASSSSSPPCATLGPGAQAGATVGIFKLSAVFTGFEAAERSYSPKGYNFAARNSFRVRFGLRFWGRKILQVSSKVCKNCEGFRFLCRLQICIQICVQTGLAHVFVIVATCMYIVVTLYEC